MAYVIVQDPCRAHRAVSMCEECREVCPADTILKTPEGNVYIQQDECINCGSCEPVCPPNAVKEVG